jgi:hypothetical protein
MTQKQKEGEYTEDMLLATQHLPHPTAELMNCTFLFEKLSKAVTSIYTRTNSVFRVNQHTHTHTHT